MDDTGQALRMLSKTVNTFVPWEYRLRRGYGVAGFIGAGFDDDRCWPR